MALFLDGCTECGTGVSPVLFCRHLWAELAHRFPREKLPRQLFAHGIGRRGHPRRLGRCRSIDLQRRKETSRGRMSCEWGVGFVVPDGLRRAALIFLRLCALASLRLALPGVCPKASATRERGVRWIHLLTLRARMISSAAGIEEGNAKARRRKDAKKRREDAAWWHCLRPSPHH